MHAQKLDLARNDGPRCVKKVMIGNRKDISTEQAPAMGLPEHSSTALGTSRVATFGRRFIRKCVAPIRVLSVPRDARPSRIYPGSLPDGSY